MCTDSTRKRENIGRLIELGVGRLKELGHSPGFVTQNEEVWTQFMHFSGGVSKIYSDRLRWAFLESFGITKRHRYRRIDELKGSIRSAMFLLHITQSNSKYPWPIKERAMPWHFNSWVEYPRFCREKKGLSENTIRRHLIDVKCFLHFITQQGVGDWSEMCASMFSRFLQALTHLKRISRINRIVTLRSFFRALFCLGITTKDWSEHLPEIAPAWDAVETYLWTPEKIDHLLESFDRSTALGKRNYAFILIAARLGIRSGDICALRLEDIDWEHSTIRFAQRKTGNGIALPLLPDVGKAIIDYLRQGRPASSRREIFLTHHSRKKPPLNTRHCFHFLKNAIKKSGIAIPPGVRAGIHSFRHSLATRLLEEGSAWPTISGVLGHTDPNSTQFYAKASMPLLRKAAIDPEEVRHA